MSLRHMSCRLTFVSGIAKKAVTRERQQNPEYMRKAPPSPGKNMMFSSSLLSWVIANFTEIIMFLVHVLHRLNVPSGF